MAKSWLLLRGMLAPSQTQSQSQVTMDFSSLVPALASAYLSSPVPAVPSQYWFVFGDSYTTTGFNVSGMQPSLDDPMGNPGYPGATLSGYDNWIDVVVFNSSRDGTVAYNYATSSNFVNVTAAQGQAYEAPGSVKDFNDQLMEFSRLSDDVMWNATNSVFFNFFGINDVTAQVYAGRDYNHSVSNLAADIADYFELMREQYELGARRFVTILVPPIYRAPVFGYGTASSATEIQTLTSYWNQEVAAVCQNFSTRYPLARTFVFDPTPIFDEILDSPQHFGAPNSTCFSYPQGRPCLWHDFIHPGVVIQEAFGLQMKAFLTRHGI
ncbi:lipolytic enzyme, G-D-S-L [Teratosphaeria destructans]|uniref:Lipolytic enzyme, G-D-S-L n=1 Tax=Teratosphaeria destructans TaxID=418781 RepID=A0A9W7SY83_9PEZI|nr:lipolytic enzyme, G-D-S-L [Teratosphaeria destructans]